MFGTMPAITSLLIKSFVIGINIDPADTISLTYIAMSMLKNPFTNEPKGEARNVFIIFIFWF